MWAREKHAGGPGDLEWVWKLLHPCATNPHLVTHRNVKLFQPGLGILLDGHDKQDSPIHAYRVQEKLWKQG